MLKFHWIVAPLLCLVMAVAGWAQEDWQRAYQVGDAVELYINTGMWQKGVVVENPPGGLLRVQCEEFVSGGYTRAGGVYIVYGKNDVRKAGGARQSPSQRPSATRPEPGQPPPQVAPGPNEAHFKRLIWEQYRDKEVGNYQAVGIAFQDLSVVNSYPNTLVEGVPRHMTAAPGAMIYRVRTTHAYTYKEGNEYRRLHVKESYFIISRDKTGQWFASPDGKKDSSIEALPAP